MENDAQELRRFSLQLFSLEYYLKSTTELSKVYWRGIEIRKGKGPFNHRSKKKTYQLSSLLRILAYHPNLVSDKRRHE